jgi:hypothetical protein
LSTSVPLNCEGFSLFADTLIVPLPEVTEANSPVPL